MRCERTIQGIDHIIQEVERAWKRLINNRLIQDKITATKMTQKRKLIRLIEGTLGKTFGAIETGSRKSEDTHYPL
jgi:hypothetical protein